MEKEHDILWQEMMAKSFHPREWYEGDDDGPEVTLMWVYRRTEPQLYTVGFYDPQGVWCPESDHDTREQAADRVHWLNGGKQVA